VAELTGRPVRAAVLLASAASSDEHFPFLGTNGGRAALPPDLAVAALQLRAYAALRMPSDSLRELFQRTENLVNSWTPRAQRARTLEMLWGTPVIVSGSVPASWRGMDIAGGGALLVMRLAAVRGDTQSARLAGERFAGTAHSYSPGAMGIDRLMAYADVLLSLHDTAAATRELDAALVAIPRARTILLDGGRVHRHPVHGHGVRPVYTCCQGDASAQP